MTRSTCMLLRISALAAIVSAMRVTPSKRAGYTVEAGKEQPATPVEEPQGPPIFWDASVDRWRNKKTGRFSEPPKGPPIFWDASVDRWRNKTTGRFSKPPPGHSRAGVCAFPPWRKEDCGADLQGEPQSIQQKGCLAKGCCYVELDQGSSEPWCFHRESTCCMNDADKEECGYYGIHSEECVDRGCCWQPVGTGEVRTKEPWCFKPKGATLKQSERPRPGNRKDGGKNTENAARDPKLSKPEVEWLYGEDGESCTDACENWGGECVEDSWPSTLAHFEQILSETHQYCSDSETWHRMEPKPSKADWVCMKDGKPAPGECKGSHVQIAASIVETDAALNKRGFVKDPYTDCASSPECEKGGLAPYKAVEDQRCFHTGHGDAPTCTAKSPTAARFCPCKETYESILYGAEHRPVSPGDYDAFDKETNF